MKVPNILAALLGALVIAPSFPSGGYAAPVSYGTVEIDGLKIFYREAGPKSAPVILLLHGFPTSSHMYRDLIPLLAGKYRVIAPDYPGYGYSDAPPSGQYAYTFDNLAGVIVKLTEQLKLNRYTIYMQDFGGPVGFRVATRFPDRVNALIIQNAVAHEEGLSDALAPAKAFWQNRNADTEKPMRGLLTKETTKFQYVNGAKNPDRISPDTWTFDQSLLDRPGNSEIQLALLYDYQNNVARYKDWQNYLKTKQPPVLVVWGKSDPFFTVAGANAYRRDVPKAELHFFETGHFALEEYAPEIAGRIKDFMAKLENKR